MGGILKVKDLMAKLKGMNPELDVIGYCEDDGRQVCFEIVSVDAVQAQKTRLPDGRPHLKIGESINSTMHALIEVSSDM